MTNAEVVLLVGGILLAVTLAVGIPIEIRMAKKNKTAQTADAEIITEQEPERKTLRVTVIDMACEVRSVGYQAYKQPKAVKTFLIKFADGGKNIYDIPVSEGMYDAFETGQKGTLTLVNGQIDSFVLDEEE